MTAERASPATRGELEDAGLDEQVAPGFDYALPPELIAQTPAAERDGARLLVMHRDDGSITHSMVRRLPDWLCPGDLMIVNRSRVIQARLRGRSSSGTRVEILLVAPIASEAQRSRRGSSAEPAASPPGQAPCWQALVRPARRLRPGMPIVLEQPTPRAGEGAVRGIEVSVQRVADGSADIVFPPGVDVTALAEEIGEPPLPPYIRRPYGPLPDDRERYQTVFASEPGSIAAPTAGLHLTTELLGRLRERGVGLAEVILHVGPSTFLAGRGGDRAIALEPERYTLPRATVDAVRSTKGRGRIVAVGTTTTRALESAARAGWPEGEQQSRLFLKPGSRFAVIDALLTNFHLPGSSLLALVSGFAGVERTRAAYREAVEAGYRFYSYGDAMLVV